MCGGECGTFGNTSDISYTVLQQLRSTKKDLEMAESGFKKRKQQMRHKLLCTQMLKNNCKQPGTQTVMSEIKQLLKQITKAVCKGPNSYKPYYHIAMMGLWMDLFSNRHFIF